MMFSVIERNSKNTAPSIRVTFPDGHSDEIRLGRHFFDDKDRIGTENDCRYFGHLENEHEACVAMTGCLGAEDVLVTIMSVHAPDSTHFLWTKDGEVSVLSPEENVRILK